MDLVHIASTIIGLLIVISRGMLVIVPATMLYGFRHLIRTNTRTRVFGLCLLPLGALLIWAGGTGHSTLAEILVIVGCIFAGATVILMIVPQAYLLLYDALVPADASGDLFGWRILGVVGVAIGCAFIYFGVFAP
jgi:hypothetical protein